MRKSTASSLLAIVVLALVLRLSPLTRFVYFGSDVGEYFRISHGLAATGHIALPYPGWGVTYPYFPGMFFLVAGASFGGLELGGALSVVVPTLAALIPAIVFLVAVRILHEPSAGLLAAAFVAVAMPHAFQTAHPIPATVGELLVVSILLLWLRLPRDRRMWALLVPATIALVVTHHLSAYFLIVMLLIGLVVVGLVRAAPLEGTRGRALYIAFLAGTALAFWLGYATTFRTSILTDVDVRPWWLPLAGFPALVGVLAGAVRLRRRWSWRYRPRYPSPRHVVAGFVIALASIYVLMSSAVLVGIIGTRIRLNPDVLWYFLPFFALLAMAGAGRKHMDFSRHGLEPGGWFLALALSAAFGAAVASRLIIPYRHVEYMIVVLAVPVGAGFARLVELGGFSHRRLASAGVAAVLLAGTALSAFPPTGLLVNYEEGIRPAALDAAYWEGASVDGLLATDHRASTIAFGFGGVNATWDTAEAAITAPDFATARSEMCRVEAPSGPARVDYVAIDEDLARGVQLSPVTPAVPLSPEARAKFGEAPYMKVYDSGFAQVYFVNWGLSGVPCP
jgi:hypothetical protein